MMIIDDGMVELAAALTVTWLENPNTMTDGQGIADFIAMVKTAFDKVTRTELVELKPEGAVSIRKSLRSNDHILSMLDGKPYRALKRHLSANGYTPESYREAFNLPASYPMVSPSYSAARAKMAKELGLGRKAALVEPEPPTAPRKPRSRQTSTALKVETATPPVPKDDRP